MLHAYVELQTLFTTFYDGEMHKLQQELKNLEENKFLVILPMSAGFLLGMVFLYVLRLFVKLFQSALKSDKLPVAAVEELLKLPPTVPRHIAVIMDGNRRFGMQKHGDALQGHWAGGQTLVDFIQWCIQDGIEIATFFAFSTENWRRDPGEVQTLMAIFAKYAESLTIEATTRNVRVRVLSTDFEKLPAKVQDSIEILEQATSQCTGLLVNICLSYGSRAEILRACNAVIAEKGRAIRRAALTQASGEPLNGKHGALQKPRNGGNGAHADDMDLSLPGLGGARRGGAAGSFGRRPLCGKCELPLPRRPTAGDDVDTDVDASVAAMADLYPNLDAERSGGAAAAAVLLEGTKGANQGAARKALLLATCTCWRPQGDDGDDDVDGDEDWAAAAAATADVDAEVDEDTLLRHMCTYGLPDPDLLIRTSGEHRISNFLLWQVAYAELFFVNKFWPDFTHADLRRVLQEFHDRHRRFGL